MKTRIKTAVLALIIFLPFLFLGGYYFLFASIFLSFLAIYEIWNIIFNKKNIRILKYSALLVFFIFFNSYKLNNIYIKAIILFFILLCLIIEIIITSHSIKIIDLSVMILLTTYISVGFYSLAVLRNISIIFIFYLLFTIWITDSAAYFGGMKYGKNKLAKNISPKKSIEGSLIGTISSIIIALVFYLFTNVFHNLFYAIILTILISILGQIGDLVESAFKREYNVKDSSNILPGHGGIFDRFDSIILSAPFLLIIIQIFNLVERGI